MNSRSDLETVGRGDFNLEFWVEIHRRLLFRRGRLQLSETGEASLQARGTEAVKYVLNCPGEEFLDFLEDIFSADCFFHVSIGDDKLVDDLNDLLSLDKLPYYVTHFVKENVVETSGRYEGKTLIHTRALPKVIMKESEVLHANAVVPALGLLQRPHFLSANDEYLAALEDYRKGDIPDCLTKCGAAFESVLKVICDRKGWKYNQTDTASTLIKTVLSNTSLEGYFGQLLIIIANLRNKLSSAHGAGTRSKQPPRHLAQYALNVTASAILLLAQETGEY